MKVMKMFLFFQIILIYICEILSDEFNLYGVAGQAYSIEINIGHPHQKLKVLVDTGSTTLAIASYPQQDSDVYFHSDNSSTVYDNEKEVHAKYSQGMWVGRLISDFVMFPSLPNVPEVRSDMVLITKSHKFFMNGSGWQGLLGLAYLPVGARGDKVVVESWLDSLDHTLNIPMSFQLKLCGRVSPTNATHYGNFQILDDKTFSDNYGQSYYTPIIHKRWYEVGVISIRVLTNSSQREPIDGNYEVNTDKCSTFNKEKSIVDSGTTSIRVPRVLFKQIVDDLSNAAGASNISILEEFWYNGEAACWPEPQEWYLPWIAIDLLSSDSDYQYFTLEIPPQNYMRILTAQNGSSEKDPLFCYKLGIEAGNMDTVLGYTAMEGLQVLFNRSSGVIGWQISDCGKARISGPYNVTSSLRYLCGLTEPVSDATISIRAAQWILAAISLIALAVLLYLLAPCFKTLMVKRTLYTPRMSLSNVVLVERELN